MTRSSRPSTTRQTCTTWPTSTTWLTALAVWIPVGVSLGLAAPGCAALECGPGTVKTMDDKGHAVCVPPSAAGIACNLDAGATIIGGVCVGDPAQFPSCGAGTHLDATGKQCLPDAVAVVDAGADALPPPGCLAPPTCVAGDFDAGHFCVAGVVRFLRDDSCTAGTPLEVRAYDPLQFLFDPVNTKPQFTVMTTASGGYKIGGLTDTSGQQLVAISVADPGGPKVYVLAGAGARNVTNNNAYRVDLYAVEATLVASWDTQAGKSGNQTFEATGAYVARFYTTADEKARAVGVRLTLNGAAVKDGVYFKNGFATLDPAQSATDNTGAVVQANTANLGQYSGLGGGVNGWESIIGAAAPGVVFVQKFHPM